MAAKTKKIISFGHQSLRKKAAPVTVFHKKIHKVIDEMVSTLRKSDDGAALAAPQVDVMKRIVVIESDGQFFELVNPEIVEHQGTQVDYEGCLSFPSYVGKVPRMDQIKVRYQDRNGEEKFTEQSGFMSRCFQHEIDHLDGILFIDRMKEDHLVHSESSQKIPLKKVKDLAGLD